MDDMSQDHIMMQDGRVMIMRKGETIPLDEDITLPAGTRVATNGTVRMPDGATRMLAEGEIMIDRQFKETMEDEELRDDIH